MCEKYYKKIQWIESIKLIASISVFWGHFYMTFFVSCSKDTIRNSLKCMSFFIDHMFHVVVDGNFWVFVFCLISGYFASKRTIKTCRELGLTIFLRYIRFLIPFTITNLLAFLIQEIIGYKSSEWSLETGSSWVAKAYPNHLSLMDVFESAFLLDFSFNGSFWVIRPIFIGSCGIYFLSLIKYIISKKFDFSQYEEIILCICYLIINIVPYNNIFYHTVFIIFGGELLKRIWDYERLNQYSRVAKVIFVISLLAININLSSDARWKALLAMVFIGSINYIKKIKLKLEEHFFLLRINDLSFGIFAIHGPILFSVCILIQQQLMLWMPYDVAFLINVLISTSLVLILAFIYRHTAESIANVITDKIKKLILRDS